MILSKIQPTRNFFLAFCFFALQISFLFAQTNWEINPNTQITFQIKNFGINVDGSFKGLKGDIQFSPNQLENSQMTVTLTANTIDTDNKARDKHLRSDDYFYVEKYPRIQMASKRFARSKSGDYIGYFDLTIRSVTKEIKVPFKFSQSGSQARFQGEFTINRRDFEVGGGSLVLSNNVTLFLDVQVSKQGS